jgi:hypothetical protein
LERYSFGLIVDISARDLVDGKALNVALTIAIRPVKKTRTIFWYWRNRPIARSKQAADWNDNGRGNWFGLPGCSAARASGGMTVPACPSCWGRFFGYLVISDQSEAIGGEFGKSQRVVVWQNGIWNKVATRFKIAQQFEFPNPDADGWEKTRGRQLRRPQRNSIMGKKLALCSVIFAFPLWLGWSSVKDCTAAGNNFYSCSAAAWVRGDIKIAGKVMLVLTLGRQGA